VTSHAYKIEYNIFPFKLFCIRILPCLGDVKLENLVLKENALVRL
jgi:hypothetical protein